ncbi:hypothetical protein [Kitasatospora sp. LaBMicrA B282]|uniref:hypothetical protein n=1 Tax=Kitasatospora sp. LaBMicrA B282 TaxID=3420949 RepID=UPI003D0C250C
MRRHTRPPGSATALAALLTAFALVTPVLAAPPARADDTVHLAGGSVALVVDAAHQHLYLIDRDGLLVDDLDGNTITTVPLDSPTSMALSDDGATVYVADGPTGSSEVLGLSTSTLQETARYALGDLYVQKLAETGGKVIVSGSAPDRGKNLLGYIDPTEPDPAVKFLPVGDPAYGYVRGLRASHGMLVRGSVMFGPEGMLTTLYQLSLYDMSGSTPGLVAHREGTVGNAASLTLTPDGQDIVGASLAEFRISDLSPVGQYSDAAPGGEIALSADGAIAITSDSLTGSKVAVYAPGATTPAQTYSYVTARLVTWGADHSRLYVVVDEGTDGADLHILDNPLTPPTDTPSVSPTDTVPSPQPPATTPATTPAAPATPSAPGTPSTSPSNGSDTGILVGTATTLIAAGAAAVLRTRRRRAARH